jgi:predicted MFS family arabinose efflux permease
MDGARSRWAPLAGFALISSANQMAWLTFAPLATGAAQRFGTSGSTIGFLSEVFPLVYVIGAVPASKVLNRSLRKWLCAGALMTALGALVRIGGTSPSGLAWVLVGQLMVAAAQPLLLNSVVALARRYLRPADRPAGIAIGSAGTFLGFVLALSTGDLLGIGRLNLLLVIGAAYAAVGAIATVVALARSPIAPAHTRAEPPAAWDEIRRLWSDPVLRGLAYFVFVGFGAFVALVTWAQPLLLASGVSATTTDTLLTLMMLGGVATSAALPPLVARRGRQLRFLVVAGASAIAACLLLAFAPSTASAAVALVLTGAMLLPGMPVVLQLGERMAAAGAAAGAALLWLAGNAGGIVVAALIDLVQGRPWLAFTVLAMVIALAIPTAPSLQGHLSQRLRAPPTAS